MPNTTEDGPWYHGSAAELQPGDLILPSGTTGLWRENMLSKDAQSVYFTSLFGLALRYALRRAEQWRTVAKVYRVEPEGPRTPDAVNVDPPVSFYCCSARVLQVYGPEDPLYAKYIGGIAAERMCRSLTGITEALDGGTEKPSFLDLLSEIVAGGRRELQTRNLRATNAEVLAANAAMVAARKASSGSSKAIADQAQRVSDLAQRINERKRALQPDTL